MNCRKVTGRHVGRRRRPHGEEGLHEEGGTWGGGSVM